MQETGRRLPEMLQLRRDEWAAQVAIVSPATYWPMDIIATLRTSVSSSLSNGAG